MIAVFSFAVLEAVAGYALGPTRQWVLFPKTVCRRKDDGTFWVPSHPKDLSQLRFEYYFKRATKARLGWFVEHSEVWRFADPSLFEVVKKCPGS